MSNSAAPRSIKPTRRDAPATLAVNLLDLGWLPVDGVVIAETGPTTRLVLAPSTGPGVGVEGGSGRLAILPLDDDRFLTVEYITATGLDDHLPESGIAVHLISDAEGTDVLRIQETLGSPAPYTDLLGAGEQLTVQGWTIEVISLDASAHLAVTDTGG